MSAARGRHRGHLVSLDAARVLGAVLVFVYHFWGDALVYARSPRPRLLDMIGPFAVSLFVVVSGVVLVRAWRSAERRYGAFVWRRVSRLLPLYWFVAMPMIAMAVFLGRMPVAALWKVPAWLLGLGIVRPDLFFPVVDGWWYITLALQVVLAFPLVYLMVRHLRSVGAIVAAVAVSAASIWAAVNVLHMPYLALGFVGSRLVELTAGAVLGFAVSSGERSEDNWAWAAALAVGVAIVGFVVPIALQNLAVAGAAAGFVAMMLATEGSFRHADAKVVSGLGFLGSLSYTFYLVHSPWAKRVFALLHPATALTWALAFAVSLCVALAVAAAFYIAFQRLSRTGRRSDRRPVSEAA